MTVKLPLTFERLIHYPGFPAARLFAYNPALRPVISGACPLSESGSSPVRNFLVLAAASELSSDETQFADTLLSLQTGQAAGLCVQTHGLDAMPEVWVKTAEQLRFPLLAVDGEPPAPGLLPLIRDFIASRHAAFGLHHLSEFSHRLQQATLKTADMHTILQTIHDFCSMQTLYYSILEPSFCLPADAVGADEMLLQFGEMMERESVSGRRRLSLSLSGGRTVWAQSISELGQTLSYIGIVLPEEERSGDAADFIVLLLEYAGKTAEQIMLRKLFLDDRARDGHAALIQDILFGDMVHEDRMLAQIGLPALEAGHYLFVSGIVVLDRPGQDALHQSVHSRNQDIVTMLRSLLSTHGIYNLLLLHHNVIHVLCIRETFANPQAQWEKVKQSLRKVVELLQKSSRLRQADRLRIHAGFGHMKGALREAAQSYREALDAVSIARTLGQAEISAFYEDMGIYQMLKSIGNTAQLIQFVHYHLGALLAYENQGEGTLLQTLDQYLSCMGSKQETAERLFIHRQTLYHRLEKLEELLGDSYLLPERRLCLEVAIRAYELVKEEMDGGHAEA